jgi:predicted double-glycine peptidase
MRRLCAALLVACGVAAAAPAAAHTLPLLGSANGLRLEMKVKGLADLKFTGIVRQGYDVSCGAAAAATILVNYYNDTDITERALIEEMMRLGDEKRIKEHGFSMLEIKRAVEEHGYVATGYKLNNADDLAKLKVPALTLINTRGYSHFVVVKTVENGVAYIADPAFGNLRKTLSEFESGWDQVVLLILNERRERNGAFVMDQTVKAPMDQVIRLMDRTWTPLQRLPGEF